MIISTGYLIRYFFTELSFSFLKYRMARFKRFKWTLVRQGSIEN